MAAILRCSWLLTLALFIGLEVVPHSSRAEETAKTETSSSQESHVSFQSLLSFEEFKNLAEELSQKVDLFRETWAKKPEAEFFGGTTRDYLYWLKGQFRGLKTREHALAQIEKLKATSRFDVRDFIIGDSDIDIVNGPKLSADDYGVKRIDSIDSTRFDPNSQMGKTEADQGSIPTEKIRLSQKGFVKWSGFEGGIEEVYRGRPTLVAPDMIAFQNTHYAQQKLNHPVLLALRYIRVLAINYYQEHGAGFPDLETLLDIDPKSKEALQRIINDAKSENLLPYLKNEKFKKWLNGSVQKAFRSYTNPTATYELFKAFGLLSFVETYAGYIDPVNQYLFAKHRDQKQIDRNLKELGVDPSKFYLDPSKEFPGLTLFHGTRTEDSFLGILFQGVKPSELGSAGKGLYGVSERNREFAEQWAREPDRLVKFQLSPKTKIVDTTKGPGASILLSRFKNNYEAFAEFVGADIVKYPYSPEAYVVKNASILETPRGYYREPLSFSRLMERFHEIKSLEDFAKILKSVHLSRLTDAEMKALLFSTKVAEVNNLLTRFYPEIAKLESDLEALSSRYTFEKFLASRYVTLAPLLLESSTWLALIRQEDLKSPGAVDQQKRTHYLYELKKCIESITVALLATNYGVSKSLRGPGFGKEDRSRHREYVPHLFEMVSKLLMDATPPAERPLSARILLNANELPRTTASGLKTALISITKFWTIPMALSVPLFYSLAGSKHFSDVQEGAIFIALVVNIGADLVWYDEGNFLHFKSHLAGKEIAVSVIDWVKSKYKFMKTISRLGKQASEASSAPGGRGCENAMEQLR